MSNQNLSVVLTKDEGSFGFSLLGKFAGIPHVIYDVIEDSPAADCEVSVVKKFKKFSSPIFLVDVFRCICLISGQIDTRPSDIGSRSPRTFVLTVLKLQCCAITR